LGRQQQDRLANIGFTQLLQLVTELYGLEADEVVTAGKQPMRVLERSLLCFWAVRELGYSVTSVASRVGLTQPAASRAVIRGGQIAR